ncbi:hypothetical protein CLOP_g2315, partial [Closterium sp. NIES-67]
LLSPSLALAPPLPPPALLAPSSLSPAMDRLSPDVVTWTSNLDFTSSPKSTPSPAVPSANYDGGCRLGLAHHVTVSLNEIGNGFSHGTSDANGDGQALATLARTIPVAAGAAGAASAAAAAAAAGKILNGGCRLLGEEERWPHDERYQPHDEQYQPHDEQYQPHDERHHPHDERHHDDVAGVPAVVAVAAAAAESAAADGAYEEGASRRHHSSALAPTATAETAAVTQRQKLPTAEPCVEESSRAAGTFLARPQTQANGNVFEVRDREQPTIRDRASVAAYDPAAPSNGTARARDASPLPGPVPSASVTSSAANARSRTDSPSNPSSRPNGGVNGGVVPVEASSCSPCRHEPFGNGREAGREGANGALPSGTVFREGKLGGGGGGGGAGAGGLGGSEGGGAVIVRRVTATAAPTAEPAIARQPSGISGAAMPATAMPATAVSATAMPATALPATATFPAISTTVVDGTGQSPPPRPDRAPTTYPLGITPRSVAAAAAAAAAAGGGVGGGEAGVTGVAGVAVLAGANAAGLSPSTSLKSTSITLPPVQHQAAAGVSRPPVRVSRPGVVAPSRLPERASAGVTASVTASVTAGGAGARKAPELAAGLAPGRVSESGLVVAAGRGNRAPVLASAPVPAPVAAAAGAALGSERTGEGRQAGGSLDRDTASGLVSLPLSVPEAQLQEKQGEQLSPPQHPQQEIEVQQPQQPQQQQQQDQGAWQRVPSCSSTVSDVSVPDVFHSGQYPAMDCPNSLQTPVAAGAAPAAAAAASPLSLPPPAPQPLEIPTGYGAVPSEAIIGGRNGGVIVPAADPGAAAEQGQGQGQGQGQQGAEKGGKKDRKRDRHKKASDGRNPMIRLNPGTADRFFAIQRLLESKRAKRTSGSFVINWLIDISHASIQGVVEEEGQAGEGLGFGLVGGFSGNRGDMEGDEEDEEEEEEEEEGQGLIPGFSGLVMDHGQVLIEGDFGQALEWEQSIPQQMLLPGQQSQVQCLQQVLPALLPPPPQQVDVQLALPQHPFQQHPEHQQQQQQLVPAPQFQQQQQQHQLKQQQQSQQQQLPQQQPQVHQEMGFHEKLDHFREILEQTT